MFCLFVLQASNETLVQLGAGALFLLSGINSAALVKLSFNAGGWVQQLKDQERRIEAVEKDNGCLAEDCPIRKN